MAPFGGELDPTQDGVGPVESSLPGLAGKVGQRDEVCRAPSGFVIGAVAVLPGDGQRLPGHRDRYRCRANKLDRPLDLLAGGLALKGSAVKLAHSLLRAGLVARLGSACKDASALMNKRAVHEKQRLLRHAGVRTLNHVMIGS